MGPVTLRPALPADEPFLLAVYASTRADEMAIVPWSEEQKQAFIRMQSNAQQQHYTRYYPDAVYSVIQLGQEPVGRLIVNRSADEILLMDIALLPQHRGHGLGTALIQDLMTEASQSGRPLRLHVETFNPALRLYQRLNFRPTREMGIYLEMEWNKPA
jgi:ribosomal protein S18 acetylase RimI-like enzyme